MNNSKFVNLFLDGARISLPQNQPIAVSLYEKNIKPIARSQKFHRPRGIFCLKGRCGSCLARINDIPNIYLCRTYPEEGMRIERQNYLGSFTHDFGNLADSIYRKSLNLENSFTTSKIINKLFVKGVRVFSGLGKVPEIGKNKDIIYIQEKEYEIAVIGGGPAGIHSAYECARMGISVCLIDDNPKLGGHLLSENLNSRIRLNLIDDKKDILDIATATLSDLGVEIFSDVRVIGILDNKLRAIGSNTIYSIYAKKYIIATGASEEFPTFFNNDLPGIIGLESAKIIFSQYNIRVKDKIVLSLVSKNGILFAEELYDKGFPIEAIIFDGTNAQDANQLYKFESFPLFLNWKVKEAVGRSAIKKVIIQNNINNDTSILNCQTLIIEGKKIPNYELLAQIGCRLAYNVEKDIILPIIVDDYKVNDDIYTAGEVTGNNNDVHIAGALSAIITAKSIDSKLVHENREQQLRNLLVKNE